MSAEKFDFMSGDTLSTIRVIITDAVTRLRIPLNGLFTAQIVFQIDVGPVISQAMTVLAGADDGIVEYQFQAGELVAGTMQAQVKITEITSAKIATTINGIKKIVGQSL